MPASEFISWDGRLKSSALVGCKERRRWRSWRREVAQLYLTGPFRVRSLDDTGRYFEPRLCDWIGELAPGVGLHSTGAVGRVQRQDFESGKALPIYVIRGKDRAGPSLQQFGECRRFHG